MQPLCLLAVSLLNITLLCSGTDEKANLRVAVPRRLQEFGRASGANYDGDIRYTDLQAVKPPGSPCAENLFAGKFACCWKLREATTNQYSYYRWICDSTPSTTDCADVDPPFDSWTREYQDPYACRRDLLDVAVVFRFEILLQKSDGQPLAPGIGDTQKLRVEIIRSIAAIAGVHSASISVVEAPQLTKNSDGAGMSTLTVVVRIVEGADSTTFNGTLPVDWSAEEKTMFMRGLAQGLQAYGGVFENIFVSRVDVSKQEELVFGSAFADAAYPCAIIIRYICLFTSIATTFALSLGSERW